jgi:hypothetical protein
MKPKRVEGISKALDHYTTEELLELTWLMQDRIDAMIERNQGRIVGEAISPCCRRILFRSFE